jgi:cytochrome c
MKKTWPTLWLAAVIAVIACGPGVTSAGDPPSDDKGIGPIKEVKLGPIDRNLADRGKGIYAERCAACHDLDKELAGPALGNVLGRATPEFVMNMILNTAEMTAKDETIKAQVEKFGMPMPPPGLSEDEARAVLEYLRTTQK